MLGHRVHGPHLPATQSFHLTVIAALSEYLLVICLASFFSCLSGPFRWWAPTEKPQVALVLRLSWPEYDEANHECYRRIRLFSRLMTNILP